MRDTPRPEPSPHVEYGRPLMRMQWRNLLFMHWPIAAERLRPLIPESLDIEEFDGSAWVGLIPFTMRDVLPALVPSWRGVADLPRLSAFHECNVRTYVRPRRGNHEPGVWFFSLDAASRAAVWTARRFFHLPYFHSRIRVKRCAAGLEYSVARIDPPRATMRCAWHVGEPLPRSQPGDMAHFLTERYALYTTDARGELRRCRIHHAPWSLHAAQLISLDDELLRAAGIDVDWRQPPIVHHANILDVHAWKLDACPAANAI